MKQCNNCKENLILNTNWRVSSQKNNIYRCNNCRNFDTLTWKRNNVEHTNQLASKYAYAKQGVYGIFSDNQCLYVGESTMLTSRINKHSSHLNGKSRQHVRGQEKLYELMDAYDNKEIRILQECQNHKERELYWINKLNPLFNKHST